MVGERKRSRRVMANHLSTFERLCEIRCVRQRQRTELRVNSLRTKPNRQVRERLENDHVLLKATNEAGMSHNRLHDRLIRKEGRDTFSILENCARRRVAHERTLGI